MRKHKTTRALARSLAVLLAAMLSHGCSDGATDPAPENSSDGPVVLDASVRRWNEQLIEVDYTLRNESDAELIAFDVDTRLQSVLIDGQLRLFKGKEDTGNVDFAAPPVIAGRNLSPGQNIEGVGRRNVPVTFEYTADEAVAMPAEIEFCIGYANADDILPLTRPDGDYALNENLELQTFSCVLLAPE